jgi:hypothetical protein
MRGAPSPRIVARPMRCMQYWLIAGNGVGRPEPLTTELADGRRVLCVFGFRGEVEQLLRLCARRGWRATGIGELVSVLSGPCAEVELVDPDPLPLREAAAPNALLRVDRQRFLGLLLRKVSGR